MANSSRGGEDAKGAVVNCFQISNFVLWQTAYKAVEAYRNEL